MKSRFFKVGQVAKRNDTGEHVRVVEVLPVGQAVFYRIESGNGDTTLVLDDRLREVL